MSLEPYERAHPFLGLQHHNLLRKIRSQTVHISNDGPVDRISLYRKPLEITQSVDPGIFSYWTDPYSFSKDWRQTIKERMANHGLRLQVMGNDDVYGILDFLQRRYPRRMADEICAFDLLRFREFGHGVVLKDERDVVRGTIFEEGYDTKEKTSFTLRLAIDKAYEGRNLGQELMTYSALLALEHGSLVKRGIIEFGNTQSLYINLNKVGWLADGFDPHINGLGSFFNICLPLDPRGLTSNQICPVRLERFISRARDGIDYRLIEATDFHGVEELYHTKDFLVAAFRRGEGHRPDQLVALPAESLHIRQGLSSFLPNRPSS